MCNFCLRGENIRYEFSGLMERSVFFFSISATQVYFLRQIGIVPETKYNCIL